MAIWFSIFLLIFTLLLTSTYFYLSILLKAQNNSIEVRKQDERIQLLAELETRIRQANQQVSRIHLKQKDLILWTPILEELAEITPSGIYLTNFSYQASTGEINLNGWANTRNNLLLFQKSLEESSFFEEIEAPLSNLIKQTGIDFSFSFKPILLP